jgi:hypothetical protein
LSTNNNNSDNNTNKNNDNNGESNKRQFPAIKKQVLWERNPIYDEWIDTYLNYCKLVNSWNTRAILKSLRVVWARK